MVVCLFEYEKEISGCLVYMVHTIRQPENRSAILPDFAQQCAGRCFESCSSQAQSRFRLPQWFQAASTHPLPRARAK
ncbi:hypothetical protein [Kingella bonacorsii]|uniref:Uncharacterized protein n=1 Tax=Kingella bonacorsii TaxID=2796361 RepID=A0ABS1BQ02_9NEIS|nr:hypothetical protein [Kingella bonacorsii]MBK0395375.1 hypothetical protein [Kingella bonacorsii]